MKTQWSSWLWLGAGLVSALLPLAAPCQGQPAAPPLPSSIVELQAARQIETISLADAAGRRGNATLINLNPIVNASFLLTLPWSGRPEVRNYHLENADPASQRVALDASHPGQLAISAGGHTVRCALWPGDMLETARRSKLPYAPLCDGKLYLRNAVKGNRSTLEATTEFLRDHVWHGEQIIGFVRREFYRDGKSVV